MLSNKHNKKLLQAVELLHRADALIQEVMKDTDDCYYIHTQVENAADDVLDFIQERNSELVDE